MSYTLKSMAGRTGRRIPLAVCLLTLLTALLVAGCGSDEGGDATASPTENVRVAMVMSGPVDDGGWGTLFKQAGDQLESKVPGTEVTYVGDIFPGGQAQQTFQALATEGYDLVMGVGGGHDADLLKVVDEFPDTRFVAILGRETRPNLATLDAAVEQGRYLDGIVAGSISERGKMGAIVGFTIPLLVRAVDGFALGARSVNPDAEVELLTVNAWNDPTKERQAAEALVDSCSDVLSMYTNTPAVPAVAKSNDVGLIGYETDMSKKVPDQWLGSFTYDWAPYLVTTVKAIEDGSWEPSQYYGDLANGTIKLLPFSPNVPEDVVAKVEETRDALASGELAVFEGPIDSNSGKTVIPAGQTLEETAELVACCDWLAEGVSGTVETAAP
jgi:basic membrane protein A